MSKIILDLPDIAGEATLSAYQDKLDAIAVCDSLEGGSGSSSAVISELLVHRLRDIASPKLAHAAAAGTIFATAKVTIFTNSETGPIAHTEFQYSSVYISRYEMDTLDDQGIALLPHYGFYGGSGVASGASTAGSSVSSATTREDAQARPSPFYPGLPRAYAPVALERVWLNYASVTWRYVPDAVERSWNLLTGQDV